MRQRLRRAGKIAPGLRHWRGSTKSGYQMRQRARMFLLAAAGLATRGATGMELKFGPYTGRRILAWLAQDKNDSFNDATTDASWLNQVEIRFSILSRLCSNGLSIAGVPQFIQHFTDSIETYNQDANPSYGGKPGSPRTPQTVSRRSIIPGTRGGFGRGLRRPGLRYRSRTTISTPPPVRRQQNAAVVPGRRS